MGKAIGDIVPLAIGVAIMAVLLLVLGFKLVGDAISGLSA